MDARVAVTEQTVSIPVTSQDRRRAYAFIVAMGLVSFFGDITYEGARGITGPFLATPAVVVRDVESGRHPPHLRFRWSQRIHDVAAP